MCMRVHACAYIPRLQLSLLVEYTGIGWKKAHKAMSVRVCERGGDMGRGRQEERGIQDTVYGHSGYSRGSFLLMPYLQQ